MKRVKGCLVAVGAIVVLVLVFLATVQVLIGIDNGKIITFGKLLKAGLFIYIDSVENNTLPRDDVSEDIDYQEGKSSRWHTQINIEQILARHGQDIGSKDILCDASIWTVIKNLPDNPPDTLIVMATRNIDPSSLRTRLTDDDMHKYIQFKTGKDDRRLLRRFAGVVRADGAMIWLLPLQQIQRKNMYRYIYFQPFDLTTNLVDGLQVKYLTPEGVEVIPTND